VCVYDKQAIFCIPPTETKVADWDLSKMYDITTKRPTPRNVALLAISPAIVEIGRRAKALSTYDASFSSAPTDYSLWDCTKTGKESPAITCTFLGGHKSDEIKNIDNAFAVHGELLTLTQVKMSNLCPTSKVGHEALGSESDVLLYPSWASYFTTLEYPTEHGNLKFKFKRDDGSLDEVTGGNVLWLPGTHYEGDSYYMSALVISHDMPCLREK
jgi:hypothetical protein